MKRLLIIMFVGSLLLSACRENSNKKSELLNEEAYRFTGNNCEFVASVVSEKNDDGSESWYFELDGYRLIRSSKEDAISYFDNFKKSWEGEEKEFGEGAGGRIIMLEKEKLDLHTVRTKTICYADLDSEPNFAVPEM
ncbi:MAG: hypothetical protein IKQ23_04435 [Treponema sp.]|nr:hypothetical protein [Treponema sp.]